MLEVKHLSYTVTENQETLPIVADISFTVNDGEMLVITGPNGGGKSTIAKLLMGVIKETEGQILLDGRDITPLTIDQRANAGIGFAFQQPPAFKGMTVRRLLNLAAGACQLQAIKQRRPVREGISGQGGGHHAVRRRKKKSGNCHGDGEGS